MEFIPKNNLSITKSEIEFVEQEKHEYKLLGTFLRTKGLKLFGYDPIKKSITEILIINDEVIKIIPDENGKFKARQKITADSNYIYFEALNKKTAEKRLNKYKKGLIKELCNLKILKKGITIW